ncbi:S41 family peptidase [Haloferula sp.]|uniref:S41 family peptidase n=1 Tax=Haloferula sp. TaxID=2497595 RepID=UPI003C79498C
MHSLHSLMRWPLLLFPLTLHAQDLPDPDEAAYPAIERFVQVLEEVRQRHPDADKLAYDRLVNHALEGMLASLDPHSSFIHPEMAAMMKENPELVPHVPSLGLTLGWRDDGPYLANTLPGSPAATLLPGSRLLELDGQDALELPPEDLLSRLQRQPGETSKLLLKSPADAQPIEITLTHRAVDNRAVTHSHLIADTEPPAGYVRLASFTDAAPREIEAALDELEDAGMKRLILDLRGNPGGSLPATVKILGYFLPPSTEVVTTRGRSEKAQGGPLKTPDRQRRQREYPITILIDRLSASASELTAGALQDLKRATVIGETSYGKGSVQNIIPMGGGTALRLTIATYHTPSGNTPHLKGISPDVEIEFTDELREKFALSLRRDSLTPEESAELKDWQDPVIKAALESD